MEIELNFRLDHEGRTAKTQKDEQISDESSTHEKLSKKVGANSKGNDIDYTSKTILTNLSSLSTSTLSAEKRQMWLDDLLFDCQISDSGLMPRTFWVPATGMKPRCHLEQMALDIFHHHVPDNVDFDPNTTGVEWWAQIRPSPQGTGRYSMHDDQPDELSRSGISFHWDKDEDLRLLTGGTTNIHPHLSTVTYLTDLGGPTLALNHRVDSLTGEWVSPSLPDGFVSWPCTGKHMSFDGRYLHAAPADLMEPGAWEKQIEIPLVHLKNDVDRKKEERLLKRRHRRVTFLVNIWLNFKPFDIKTFPDTMIDKMSGLKDTARNRLSFILGEKGQVPTTATTVKVPSVQNLDPKLQLYTWPMGDCDSKEFIEAIMPLHEIRQQSSEGGNVQILWEQNTDPDCLGVRLYKEPLDKRKNTDEEIQSKSPKRSKNA